MTDTPPPAAWYLRIPPPIWTFALLGLAYLVQSSFAWGAAVHARAPMPAIALAVAGLALAIWGERTFAGVGTEILPASPTNKMLVTKGPFRFTRNPMYLGLILVTLGIALYFGTAPFFAVPLLLFLLVSVLFIPFEEAKMQRQFGAAYTEYRARVRRWI